MSIIIPYAKNSGKITESPIKRIQCIHLLSSLCYHQIFEPAYCSITFFNDIMNLCQDTEVQVRFVASKCLSFLKGVFPSGEPVERIKREITDLLKDEETTVADEAIESFLELLPYLIKVTPLGISDIIKDLLNNKSNKVNIAKNSGKLYDIVNQNRVHYDKEGFKLYCIGLSKGDKQMRNLFIFNYPSYFVNSDASYATSIYIYIYLLIDVLLPVYIALLSDDDTSIRIQCCTIFNGILNTLSKYTIYFIAILKKYISFLTVYILFIYSKIGSKY